MVVDRFIFKNNPISLSSCLTFILKTGVGIPKTGVRFYGVLDNRIGSNAHLLLFSLVILFRKHPVEHRVLRVSLLRQAGFAVEMHNENVKISVIKTCT